MRNEYKQILINKNILLLNYEDNTNVEIKDEEIGSILHSFASVGFTIEKEYINLLRHCSLESLKTFYFESIELLKEIKGANANHIVFYENFPFVENISETEYYLRAILHYCTAEGESYGYKAEDLITKDRIRLNDISELIPLKILKEEEGIKILIEYANNMFEAKKVIPATSFSTLQYLIEDYSYFICPTEIPFKENLAFYARCIALIASNKKVSISTILSTLNLKFIKTSTDLLRIYVAFSNGDITLIQNTKFISLNRSGRKTLLKILDNLATKSEYVIDDMAAHEFLWKKALEKLHIGNYSKAFPNAYKVATMLRNDDYTTYNSAIYKAYKNKETKQLLNLLSIKPGVFARSIDYLLRNLSNDSSLIIEELSKVATKVSSPLLIQLWQFYKNRDLDSTRLFVIKGRFNSTIKEIDENRNQISDEVKNRLVKVIEDTLKTIYSNKNFIEKVYLDPSMKNYTVPTNNRNVSGGYHTLSFGSKIKLDSTENSPILRFFTHWKNIEKAPYSNRVDIDLSLQLYDEKFNNVAILAWHNMQGGGAFNSYHSGDLVNAPDGASEFIDLDYKTARKVGRYALVCNNVFTRQDFANIPECFSGVMFRKNKGKYGEIFEPTTVKHKFDLTQKCSYQNLALAVDLETLEMIWIDFPFSQAQSESVAAHSSLSLAMILKRALKQHMSIYDLIMLHHNHLQFCEKKEDATFIISDSSDANLTPFDIEKINSEWL